MSFLFKTEKRTYLKCVWTRKHHTNVLCILELYIVLMFKIPCLFSLIRQTLEVPNLPKKDIKAFHMLWFLDLL